MKQESVDGWGFNYYLGISNGDDTGTLMSCATDKKTNKFIHLQPQLVRYNSKLPIVLLIPNNMTVRYRI
jgi:ecotin